MDYLLQPTCTYLIIIHLVTKHCFMILRVCLLCREDSTFVHIRSLDLGHVCQHNLVDDSAANVLSLEAVVRATTSSNLTAGDTITLSAAVLVNDEMLAISQMNLTLTLVEEFNDTEHDVVSDVSV